MSVQVAKKFDTEPALKRAEHLGVLTYWKNKHPDGRLPAPRDIDPSEIPREALSSIFLVTVEHRGAAEPLFRYRLIGTSIVCYCGRDVTGLTFEDAHEDGEHLAAHRHFYQQAVESKDIQFSRSSLMVPGREYIECARLLLPFANDGYNFDMILGSLVFELRNY